MSTYKEIERERELQDERWGPEHDDNHAPLEWLGLIAHHAGKAFISGRRNGIALEHLSRVQLVRVAALAVAAIESIDRSNAPDCPTRAGETMSEQTACGCQRIHYQPEDLEDGHFRERWRCLACTSEFVRAGMVAALEARLSKMEPAAIEAEKMFDVMAIEGIKEWLTIPLRQLYAEVHTDLREALAGESDDEPRS